jgi:hypothetical protein
VYKDVSVNAPSLAKDVEDSTVLATFSASN